MSFRLLYEIILSQSLVFSDAMNTSNYIQACHEGEALNCGFQGFDTM
jgi:hypothetical protein